MGICQTIKNKYLTQQTSTTIRDVDTKTSNKIINKENDIIIKSNLFVNKIDGLPSENYIFLKKLGEGSYGVVWKVKHLLTSHNRAMKRIVKNPRAKKDTEQNIINEIEILRKMDHPNIVKIFEFYNTVEGYYLITEFCEKGELFQVILENAPFKEFKVAHIMFQIFSAVNYCHSSNIIHRDLKPENILIHSIDENGNYFIKIIDFGTAKLYAKNKSENKLIGSSYYIAPEVLKKDYNEKCDIWSCGVIMYIMLSGRAPFSGDKDSVILEKIKLGKYDLKKGNIGKISNDAKDLIKKLLESNPKKRFSASDALKHSWFKRLDIKKYFCEVDEELLLQTIENLKKYNPAHKLQQVVLAYLVHNFPNIDQICQINKIFNLFDENSDGKLTKDEMINSLTKYLKRKKSKLLIDEVNAVFSRIDTDGNGYIEFEEFIRGGIDKYIFLEEDILRFAFEYFDKDNSGEISVEELGLIFCVENDVVYTEKLLMDIMKDIDTDGNSEISFPEFRTMMEQILENEGEIMENNGK